MPPKNRNWPMSGSPLIPDVAPPPAMTDADRQQAVDEHFGKMRTLLEDAKVPELVRHMERMHHLCPEPPARVVLRVPLGLIGAIPSYPEETICISPSSVQLCCKLEHLVLSDLTAASYDIVDIKQGHLSDNINCDPLPAECFSIVHVAGEGHDKLVDAMRFRVDPLEPGMRMQVYARLRPGAPLTPFRGLAWMAVLS